MKILLRSLWLCSALVGIGSCYAPDYTHVIYKCDRGKCPEDYYCISDNYCTKKVDTCSLGGVQVSDTAAACIGRTNSNDANSACSGGATPAKCDAQMVSRELCKDITACTFCCK